MADALREMFQYHTWATLTLLDYCATLPPAQLDDTAPGTMGSIYETLAHMIASDAGYFARMTGDDSVRIRDAETLSLADLRARFVVQSKRWESALDQLDQFDPTIPEEEDYPETPHATNLLLTQAIHHGNDHRTHICTILGANGLDVPWMDVWSHWAAVKH